MPRALLTLVDLARGNPAEVKTRLAARIDALIKEAEAKPDAPDSPRKAPVMRPTAFPWTDYFLARAVLTQDDTALLDQALRLADLLIDSAQKIRNFGMLARLRTDVAVAQARREGSQAFAAGSESGLPLWHATGYGDRTAMGSVEGGPAPWWVASQGVVTHLAGHPVDFLLFDYPLTGTYEFSVDAFDGGFAQGSLTHNGLVLEPSGGAVNRIFAVGGNDTNNRTWKLNRANDFNRFTVQVAPGKVRYMINGHLFHQDDDPSPTSPWVGLFTRIERKTAWRHPVLHGNPTIPREVRLTHADRLEGWISSFYNESQPTRMMARATDEDGNPIPFSSRTRAGGKGPSRAPVNPDNFDWAAKGGEILGRRLVTTPAPTRLPLTVSPGAVDSSAAVQSRLYYFRPLRDGDTLSYEFYYEPDQVMAHPSMDRLAFLLEPEGIRLHWMTSPINETSGLFADNVVDTPSDRLGSDKPVLKPADWNTLTLALEGDVVTLELNGRAVYRRALEPSNGRQFGLYHDKDRTSVRVRNVVLRGRWPATLGDDPDRDLAGLPASALGTDADRHARHAIIGEQFLGHDAGDVLRRAGEMTPKERYAFLSGWVLPGPDHPVFRLHGEFSPSNPAPKEGAAGTTAKPDAPRTFVGGEIRAPALELVETARSLGRLDELATEVEMAEAVGDVNLRGKLGLLTLVAVAGENDAEAAVSLTALKPLLETLPLDQPEWIRWPELVATASAVRRPALRAQAIVLLDTMAVQAQKKSAGKVWQTQVKTVRARGRLLAESSADEAEAKTKAFGADPRVPHWASVIQARAETRGSGGPVAAWTYFNGEFTHHPGHALDMMYLGVPLRGDFQLDCELNPSGWREVRVSYGGMMVGPKADLKHVIRSHYGRALPEITIIPPLERPGDWYKYRLVVKGSTMTSFVDGRQIHQAALPTESDPWLALYSESTAAGGARFLKIIGHPTIPDRLNLSALPDLTGWRVDEYQESVTGDTPDWDKRGDEIHARRRDDAPGSQDESVLRYHRPLLEDGEIAYEFYYEPSEVLAHPAIDRLAFLLEPDGVKLHRLTDAQYERGGLSPANASVEADYRRGPGSLPLKPKAWNHAVVSLVGDTVAIRLNGVLVYERPLEPTNQRNFGLFHYADETEVRVRNVTYRGEWPRAFPAGLIASAGDVEKAATRPEPEK